MGQTAKKLNVNEHKHLHLSDIYKQYFSDLYGNASGYVKLVSGRDYNSNDLYVRPNSRVKKTFLSAKCLLPDRIEDAFNLVGFSTRNLRITSATYKDKSSAAENNIDSILMLTVDVDFKNFYLDPNHRVETPAEQVADILIQAILEANTKRDHPLPIPQYIEYGHRLRLIYKLDKPIYIGRCKGKKRRGIINLIKKILHNLSTEINKLDPNFGADPDGCKLTNTIRVPNSLNVKFSAPDSLGHCRCIYKYLVGVKAVNTPYSVPGYSLQDMIDAVLPADYKKKNTNYSVKKKNNSNKVSYLRNEYSLMEYRKDLLRKAQEEGTYTSREFLAFAWWNCCKWQRLSDEACLESTLEFNNGFDNPLTPDQIRIDAKAHKPYKYSNWLFKQKIGLADDEATKKELNHRAYVKKRQQLVDEGKTKKQLLEKDARKVQKLRAKGLSIRQIAQKTNLSKSKVNRLLQKSP